MPQTHTDPGISLVQLGAMLAARKTLMVLILLATVALAVAASVLLPKTYTATAELFIDYRASDPIAGRQFSPMQDESYMQTQMDILRSDDVARHVIAATGMMSTDKTKESIAKLGEATVRSQLSTQVIKSLEILPRRSSRVLELKFSAKDPLLARDALNAAIKGYMDINTRIHSAPAKSRQEQYSGQLQALQAEIDRIQTEITNYQQQAGILDTDERLDTGSRQYNELSTRLAGLQASQAEAAARKRAIQTQIASGARPADVPEISRHEGIRDIKLRLIELNSRIADAAGVLGSNHPRFKALLNDKAAMEELLAHESRSVLKSLEMDDLRFADQAGRLGADLQQRQQALLEMKKHRDVIASYQRQLASVQQIYTSAVQKYDEILMASNVDSPNMAVLQWAEKPHKHSKPLLVNNVLFSIPAGLMLALLSALLLEFAQRRVRCVEDLQTSLPVPVLGGLT